MKSVIRLSIIIGFFCLILHSGLSWASSEKPIQLRIASTEIGGNWYLYGSGIADLVKPILPTGSTIDVLPRAGGIANPILVNKGEAEIGLSLAVNANWAYEGKTAYKEANSNIRSLIGGLDIFFMGFFASEQSGLKNLLDFKTAQKPIRLITTPVGGLGEYGARQLLEANDTSYKWIEGKGGFVRHVSRGATVDYLKENKADAWAHIVSEGFPLVTELGVTVSLRMVQTPVEVVAKLKAEGWAPYSVPVGLFDFIKEPVATVGTSTTVLVSKDMSTDLAYKITKEIVENKEKLAKVHSALKDFKPEQGCWTIEATGVPLHPGAEKYYKERKWLK